MAWRVSAHIRCGGVAATGQRSLRTLGGGTWHCEAEDQPVSILQDFLIAIARESESNLGRGVADPQEGTLLVGAVPAEGAICAGAAVAPVAMIGLGTGGSGKDREVGQRVKGGVRQLASLECQPQENRSPFRSLELECQWHFSPASGIKGPKSSNKVL